jgi:hypothetical protein
MIFFTFICSIYVYYNTLTPSTLKNLKCNYIHQKKDRQCMYNVTLKCIHVMFIPVALSQQSDNISLEQTFYGDVMLLKTIRNN